MNRIHRTVWNDITRTFVAVAEKVRARGKAGGSRTGALVAAETRLDAPVAPRRMNSGIRPLALEQRFMFDGAAAAATVDAHAHDSTVQAHDSSSGADAAIAAAAAASAAAQAARADTAREVAKAAPLVSEPQLVRAADPTLVNGRREVAFIDTNVTNYQSLVNAIGPGIEVRLIDGSQNGLEQIAQWAATHSGYDAIHILSHGDSGSVTLGSFHLTNTNVDANQEVLSQIGAALKQDGDILIYGCDVAQGEAGIALVNKLSQTTHADVAASNDLTGTAALGANWTLEVSAGKIESSALHIDHYDDVLANPTVWTWGTAVNVQGGQVLTVPNDTFYIRADGTTSTIIKVPANQYFAYNTINSGGPGYFEYSTNNGTSWTTLSPNWSTFAPPNSWVRFHATSSTVTEVDFGAITCLNPTNMTTAANSGAYNGAYFKVRIDSAPTDISSDNTSGILVSDTPINSQIALLTPTDGGAYKGGYWTIDSQSVAGVFSLSSSTATTNTASLNLGSLSNVADGQQVSVTVRYYDALQTDTSGNPINGQGVAKTFTFTVKGASHDLNFGHDVAVNSLVGDTADQVQPATTTLSNGNYVVSWADSTNGGIYAQVYDATGVAQGGRLTLASGSYLNPSVTALANGKFAVVYGNSSTQDLLYKIIDSSTGTATSSGTVEAYSPGNGGWDGFDAIAIASNAAGSSFVVTWNVDDYATIKSATFSDAGVKSGATTNLSGAVQGYAPSAAILSNGAVATAAIDGNVGGFNIVIGTTLVTGSPIGDNGAGVSLSALAGGGFVASWSKGDGTHILAQIFNNAGTATSSIFQVDTRGTTMGSPKVTTLSNGDFIIVWESNGLDGSGYSVEGRRFSAAGVAVDTGEFEINEYRYGDQMAPAVTALANGGFATSWTDSATGKTTRSDIETRVFSAPVPAPTVTGVSSSTANGTYKVGDTVSIQVAFSEAVTVTGTPQLTLETGVTDRVISYVSGSGTGTLTFNYTVQAGDTSADLNYLSTSALVLNGGTVKSAGSVDAVLTLPGLTAAGSLGTNQAIVVDGVVPVISNVTIPNMPRQVGDTVTATITVTSDLDSYTLNAGSIAGFALSSLTKVNNTTYTATFAVTAGATAYAAADSIPVSLSIKDTAGNVSTTYTTAITQNNDRIDTNAPPVAAQPPAPPTLIDTAANDTFPIIQGTLSATDPEGQTLTFGIPSNSVSGSWVVGGVSYDRISSDAVGNAQYVNSQTGDYAYVFAAAFLNGFPSGTINTVAHFSVSDGNRSVQIDVPLSFQGANDAPVLSNDGRTLHAIDQGIADGANTGNTVTSILASAGTATDAEYNPAFVFSGNTTAQGVTILPLGMAITAVDNTNGAWQYKLGNGAWTAISGVSSTSALLLTGADSVRFVPASGTYAGTNTGGISFKAWDRTSGTAGALVDPTGNSAFSDGVAAATIAVDALPTLAATGGTVTFGVGSGSAVDLFSAVSASTIEQSQYFSGARITVSGVVDSSEILTFGGVNVALVNGTVSLPGLGVSGGNATATVTVTSGVATISIGGLQQSDSPMSALLDGLGYKNTSAGATLGNRTVSIVGLTDSGGSTGQAVTSGVSTMVTVADVTPPAAPPAPDMTAGSDTGASSTDNITSNATPTFTGTAEPLSLVTLYDTDGTTVLGTANANGSGNWSITSSTLNAGSHTLTVKAADASGNVSTASAGLAVTIDTTAPTGVTLSADTVASATTGSSGATIATVSATDTTAVTYSLVSGTGDADNASFAFSGSTLVTSQAITAGSYSIRLRAVDAAGNETFEVRTITVVDAPFVSSIVRAGGAAATVATSATQVTFNVTFNESVSGVDASDFVLTSTGTAVGTITTISGSGASYAVVIDGLSGDGTLRLDLKGSGTGIQNGGSVAVLGGYTAGASYTLDHTAPSPATAPDLATSSDSGSSSTDKITNVTTPTISGTAEANSTVTLYDTDGTTVLGSITADGSGNWSITTSTLSQGTHTLTTRVTDAAGNVSVASAGTAITIDTSVSAPSIALATDTGIPGDGRTATGTVNVSGLESGATWEYSLNGGTTWLAGTGTSVTLTGDGAKSVTVRQTDAAGNLSTASSALNFMLDTTPPLAPTIALATDTGTVGDGNTSLGTVDVAGLEAGATWEYSTDGGTTWTAGVGTSLTLTGDGAKTLTVRQTDTEGNVSTSSTALNFTLDTAAPNASSAPVLVTGSDSGVSNSDNITNVTTPTFTGTTEAGSTVRLYDTDGTTVLGTTTADGSGHWSITSSALSTGAHTLTTKVTDVAGNVSGASASATVAIDTSVATPAITLANDTGVVGDGRTSVGTINVAGLEAVATWEYSTDGGTTWTTGTGTSFTLSGDGAKTITVRQTDVAGNVSTTSAALNFTLDSTAPTTSSAPALASGSDSGASNTDNITNVTTPTFNGTAEPGSTVRLYDTDGTTVLGTATADGSGHWSITSTTLDAGTHTLTTKVSDTAGNVSAASPATTITVDTTAAAPGIALATDTGVAGDGLTSVGTVNVTGLEPGATWEYSTDGGTTWHAGTGASVTLSGDGAKSIVVRQLDAAGNASAASAALNFTLDTTPASAPAISLAEDTDTPGDRITSNSRVNVTGLEAGASWQYSIDGGTNWIAGSGTSVTLIGEGDKTIIVRQIDVSGNVSAASSALSFTLRPDTPPPVPVVPAAVVPETPAAPLVVNEPAPVAPPTVQFIGASMANEGVPSSPLSTPLQVQPPRATEASELGIGTQMTLTTPNAPGGFRAVILPNTGGQGDALVLLRGVANAVLEPAVPVDLVIPVDAFGHTNPDAVVRLTLTLANGQALPSWVQFDTRTGKLHVDMPANFRGTLNLVLTARDAQGRQVATTFRISAANARPVSDGRMGLSDKLRLAAQAQGVDLATHRLRA